MRGLTVLVFFLFAFSFLQVLPLTIYAAGPSLRQYGAALEIASTGVAIINKASEVPCCSTAVVAGDLLVVTVRYSTGSLTDTVQSVSDSYGNSFSQAVSFIQNFPDGCGNGANYVDVYQYVYYSIAKATNSSVTVQIGSHPAGYAFIVGFEDFNPGTSPEIWNGVVGTATGFSTVAVTNYQTSTSVARSGTDMAIEFLNPCPSGLSSGTSTGAGYSAVDPAHLSEAYSSTAASPTNFPYSQGIGSYEFGDVGVVFGQSLVTVVGPCNFLQLQCWWYPSLFMMLFSGFFLMVAGVSRAPPKVAMHLFLSGLTYGSFVAVIFGIMNITLPLALLLINTFYVLRIRGR